MESLKEVTNNTENSATLTKEMEQCINKYNNDDIPLLYYIQNDKEIMQLLVSKNIRNLSYASTNLLNDKNFIETLIGCCGIEVLRFANKSLKNDKDFVLNTIEKHNIDITKAYTATYLTYEEIMSEETDAYKHPDIYCFGEELRKDPLIIKNAISNITDTWKEKSRYDISGIINQYMEYPFYDIINTIPCEIFAEDWFTDFCLETCTNNLDFCSAIAKLNNKIKITPILNEAVQKKIKMDILEWVDKIFKNFPPLVKDALVDDIYAKYGADFSDGFAKNDFEKLLEVLNLYDIKERYKLPQYIMAVIDCARNDSITLHKNAQDLNDINSYNIYLPLFSLLLQYIPAQFFDDDIFAQACIDKYGNEATRWFPILKEVFYQAGTNCINEWLLNNYQVEIKDNAHNFSRLIMDKHGYQFIQETDEKKEEMLYDMILEIK